MIDKLVEKRIWKEFEDIIIVCVKSRHWDEEYDESLYLFGLLRGSSRKIAWRAQRASALETVFLLEENLI